MFDFSIKIKNYKCFLDEAGFDSIQRVNLIIGRNNTGKSALLDIIQIAIEGTYSFEEATWRDGNKPQIIFKSKITESVVNAVFPASTSGGKIPYGHRVYGNKFIDREIIWTQSSSNKSLSELISCDDNGITPPLDKSGYHQVIPRHMPMPLETKIFKRVLAERDILPEPDNSTITIQPNGAGTTNAIQRYINRSNLPSNLVEVTILNALNEIFAHDAVFTDIVSQLHENGTWEIYLEEKGKGRIALSKSGSGLKTVFIVLAFILIVPELESQSLDNYVFGFEELENNIHPALLRRLNDYIYRKSLKHNFTYFLTTHSNVLIDQFSKQSDAQILHIIQSDAKAECKTVKTYVENNGILDDLDVRASDLLQANGIIWVEGPSDRVYMNRWIELWSDGLLKEGTHYQIIFYGGRLLSHLSADVPEDIEDGISILNTNRNAIILIDSDKKNRQSSINPTKQRMKSEFESLNSLCWITKGKEIENYIPAEVVDKLLGVKDSAQVGTYESFFDYADSIKKGEGTRYSAKKPMLAEKLVQYMSIDNLKSIMDIDTQMKAVCIRIKEWNT